MALLTKEEILGFSDLVTQDIPVPEWNGGSVRISVMPGWARDEYESLIVARGKKGLPPNIRAKYLSYCLVDESNNLLFTPQEVELLGKKSSKALDRVFEAASNLNATTEEGMLDTAKN